MPFVIRDQDGKILRVNAKSLHGSEYIDFNNKEFVSFLKQNNQDPSTINEAISELQRTDNDMSRIIEDVVRALLKKNILRMSDLPASAQEKLTYRINMRCLIEETLNQATQTNQSRAQQESLKADR